jgi:hypothetical protein
MVRVNSEGLKESGFRTYLPGLQPDRDAQIPPKLMTYTTGLCQKF